MTHQHVTKSGEMRVYELVASPYLAEDGSLLGIIESSRDITDRLSMQKDIAERDDQLEFLTHHDPLTNLPNRLQANDRLQHAMRKSQRSSTQVAVLFLDLDRFKNFNDSLGHAIGDEILCQVADRLRSQVRGSDTVARLGGDEFLIILEELKDALGAATLAQKTQQVLTEPMRISGQELTLTVSIGISTYPVDAASGEELLKCAEVAMYRAKEQGPNSYQFYTPDMNAHSHELLLLEADLRKALEQDQLVLHYQPQYELKTGRILGVEALVRWQHPEKGMISPDEFIPLAEETGLIVPLGEWVMHTACKQTVDWQRAGHSELKIAVNVSAHQFRQSGFLDSVNQILNESRLHPHCLEIEITESTVMTNVSGTIKIMNQLHRQGISLAIDDFGTGYSSLSYQKRFPLSKLKIDRSFVSDITYSANDLSIAKSIIALAETMQMDVLAEGIETQEQQELLQKMGCDYGQGFFFSKPLPAEELEPFLRKRGE